MRWEYIGRPEGRPFLTGEVLLSIQTVLCNEAEYTINGMVTQPLCGHLMREHRVYLPKNQLPQVNPQRVFSLTCLASPI